jgi:ElaB/YqjD/DUF883 family membrane-anchored ribosome-binding protein
LTGCTGIRRIKTFRKTKENMINKSETEEKKYLEEVKGKLSRTLDEIDKRVSGYDNDLKEQKNYLCKRKITLPGWRIIYGSLSAVLF